MDLLQDPRYKDTPVYLFFEKYILNVIGHLSEEKITILQQIDLQGIFSTQANNWKDIVKEVLQLSSTIDIAIMYSWCIYLSKHEESEIDPTGFSRNFVDAYFREESTIDIWTEESLLEAKQYIQESQFLEKA